MRDETPYQRAGDVGRVLDIKQVSSQRMIHSAAFLDEVAPVPADTHGDRAVSEPVVYESKQGTVWRRDGGVGYMATRLLGRSEDGRSGWSEVNLHIGTLEEAVSWVEEDLSNG